MDESRAEKIAVGLHTIVGVIAGYVSIVLPQLYAIPLGIALLVVVGTISMIVSHKKETKWWLVNGIWIYLLVWLVAWTFFLNNL